MNKVGNYDGAAPPAPPQYQPQVQTTQPQSNVEPATQISAPNVLTPNPPIPR
jgi:hypothetical protein